MLCNKKVELLKRKGYDEMLSWKCELAGKTASLIEGSTHRPLGICLVFWQKPCALFLIAIADYSRMAEPDEDW